MKVQVSAEVRFTREIDALIAEEIHDITVYKTHLNDTEWAWWLILIAQAQLPKPIPGQRDIFGGEVKP